MAVLKTKKDKHDSMGLDNVKEFSIDTESHMIVSILRDKLYKNKIAAVCREVASNGRDANREAGKKDVPVIISIHEDSDLIGDASTLISFKDSGIGISPDRIDNVFLKYGGSTKRDTNGQTGGFGIGAKTPFAYTNNFIITTISEVDGVNMKYVYQALIIADGKREASNLILISEEKTNEPTGTTITVPIGNEEEEDFDLKQAISEFEWETIHATAMWDVKPTLIGFSEHAYVIDKRELKVVAEGEGWCIVEDGERLLNSNRDIVASVDGIPYTIDSNEISDYNISEKLSNFFSGYGNKLIPVLKLNTGDVSLSASREDVEYIKENLSVLVEAYDKMKTELKAQAVALLNSKKTTIEKAHILNLIKQKIYTQGDNSKTEEEAACETFYHVLGNLRNNLLTEEENEKMPSMFRDMAERHSFVKMNLHNTKDQKYIGHFHLNAKDIKEYPILYRTSNSCARRNQTLLNEGHQYVILVMPPKSGRDYLESTDISKSKRNLKKLLAEIDIKLTDYADVERVELPKREKKERAEKDSVGVPVRTKDSHGKEWSSESIECERDSKKKPTGKIMPKQGYDKSKTILLAVDSVSDLKGKMDFAVLFSDYPLPEYMDEYNNQRNYQTAFNILRAGGYQIMAVSKSKAKCLDKSGFKNSLISALNELVKSPLYKKGVQNIIDMAASEEVDINGYVCDIYLENPLFLKLAGLSVKDFKQTEKISNFAYNEEASKIRPGLRGETLQKMAKFLKLKPKDFGVSLTEKDIDDAFSKVRSEHPVIHFMFSELESTWTSSFHNYTPSGISSEGRAFMLKKVNEMIQIELDKLENK